MFSKAKRFDALAPTKNQTKSQTKRDVEKSVKAPGSAVKPANSNSGSAKDNNLDTQSQGSSVHSTKSFKTPKPFKHVTTSNKTASNIKKTLLLSKNNLKKSDNKFEDEIIKAHEVEVRNKDFTISEYNKQIDDLKNEIAKLNKILQHNKTNNFGGNTLETEFSHLILDDDKDNKTQIEGSKFATNQEDTIIINKMQTQIIELEKLCEKLDQEVSNKQVELTSLEEVITIRDSLCADLQKKLTDMESSLEETRKRLEMVKGHHSLALEANESIRREYKAEIETLKLKLDEEKQSILAKSKHDQDILKQKYNILVESIKKDLTEDNNKIKELQQKLIVKDQEMKAKLEQIKEATHEKLRICEIQFEERSRQLQEHWSLQQTEIESLEHEMKELKYTINKNEEQNTVLQKEIKNLQNENDTLKIDKTTLVEELEKIKDETKKTIDLQNEINKLTLEVDRATKEKHKFEMSLSVTRDIVQVLTMRLRESDNELEHLENEVVTLRNCKEKLESELVTYKNNTVLECNEYKEALVKILKSKAALAKEHNRIIEHNVSLIESLQNVEKEAYRELGTIKSELIEDVELIKKETISQIQMLKDELEKKRVLCELANEHAGQASAAVDQSRALLAHAAAELTRLETENRLLQTQIQDQQSLVVELSLLRQENEELTMTLAKQSSVMEKMKKDAEQGQLTPKSPSMIRKSIKVGKENIQTVISPLRERNH